MAAASTFSPAPESPLTTPIAAASGHDDLCRLLHNDQNQLLLSSSQRQQLLGKSQDAESSKSCIHAACVENSAAISFLGSSDRITVQEQPAIAEHSSSEVKGVVEGGEGSTSSDGSEECSTSSGGTSFWSKPHKVNDARWKAIRAVRSRNGDLVLSHFRLQKKLGCGDIGTVYLAELSGTNCFFALKIMNKDALESRKKLPRAQTEREILERLDHPFLPTLYTHFETEQHSCLVMEYCPGGDLHALRQRQPGKCFSEQAARCGTIWLDVTMVGGLREVLQQLKGQDVSCGKSGWFGGKLVRPDRVGGSCGLVEGCWRGCAWLEDAEAVNDTREGAVVASSGWTGFGR